MSDERTDEQKIQSIAATLQEHYMDQGEHGAEAKFGAVA